MRSASAMIEALESRRLLSSDVAVDLQVVTPANWLLAGAQPRDLIFDSLRHQLLAVLPDKIERYDAGDGQLLGSINLGADLHAGDITPDGKYLYAAELHNPDVYKIDLDTSTYVSIAAPADASQATPGDVAMAMSGPTSRAIVGQYPESPYTLFWGRRIDLGDDSVSDVSLNSGLFYLNDYAVMARSADYSYVSMVSPHDVYAYKNDTLSGYGGQLIGNIYGLAVSRDGGMIAVAKSGGIDVVSSQGNLLKSIVIAKSGVAFSTTANLLYVADSGGGLLTAYNTTTWSKVWSVAIGENIPNANPYGSGVMTVSDDGNVLYMATPGGVRMFDLTHGSAFYGDAVTFEADVTSAGGAVSGVVTFIDQNSGATLGQGTIVGGTATLALSALHAGSYSVLAHYEGDASFNAGDSAMSGLTVKRARTTAVLSVDGPTTVTLTVTSAAGIVDGGTVTLLEGAEVMGSGVLSLGSFSFDADFSIGTHLLVGEFGGNGDFLPASSAEITFVVKEPTVTLLESSAASIVYGEALEWTATITAGNAAVGGTVNFIDGSNTVGSAMVDAQGKAALNVPSLGASLHNITAEFLGNVMLLGSVSSAIEVDVAQAATTISVVGPGPTIYGNVVSVTASVGAELGLVVNEGQVRFMRGTELLGNVAVVDGEAQLSGMDLAAGTNVITATYLGTSNLEGTAGSDVSVSILKAATSVGLIRSATWIPKGQWVLWQATANSIGAGGAQVGGSVTFKDGTKVIKSVSLVGGVATFKSKSLAVGDHTVTATYVGNSGFKASVSKGVKTTVVAGTTIDLMIVYTQASVNDMGSLAAMARRVNDSVWGTNTAFWNSRIPVAVRLVYSGLVNYAETGKLSTDLTRLAGTSDGFMDNVHALRNQYKADLVSLFEYDGDAGGLGYELMDVGNSANSRYGFSVVITYQAAGPSYTLAHELGHNFGASHDKANAGGAGATSYSYGWRFKADGVLYHDIMAYNPGQTIPYFSNPRVKYKGVPTGTATADSARTITFTAPYVAAYRK
ncbi:MAG TPA: Ig-like domain repeat protein [Tepidisphaeraceae bacterium]|nr:Ig-like domain repeat protein [Tepidisphaeraceae bacterium]